jgi:hypothetical protein
VQSVPFLFSLYINSMQVIQLQQTIDTMDYYNYFATHLPLLLRGPPAPAV